jgi:hypothetical protein
VRNKCQFSFFFFKKIISRTASTGFADIISNFSMVFLAFEDHLSSCGGIVIKIEFSFLSLYFEFRNFLVSYIVYVLFVYICSYSCPLSLFYLYIYVVRKKKKERAVQNGHFGGCGVGTRTLSATY